MTPLSASSCQPSRYSVPLDGIQYHSDQEADMIEHEVRTYPSAARLAREDQLAWKLAAVATDPAEVTDEVTAMVINRVIDDAAVAAASLARGPVRAAREQALRHATAPGAV